MYLIIFIFILSRGVLIYCSLYHEKIYMKALQKPVFQGKYLSYIESIYVHYLVKLIYYILLTNFFKRIYNYFQLKNVGDFLLK